MEGYKGLCITVKEVNRLVYPEWKSDFSRPGWQFILLPFIFHMNQNLVAEREVVDVCQQG